MTLKRLVVAEGGKFHHDADNVLTFRQACNPAEPLVCHERILRPRGIVEAESDVVAKLVVAQDEREARVLGTGIDVVGTLPSEDVLCTFHHNAFEAHVGHERTNLVAVDERTVAEDLGGQSEHLFDFLCLTLGLGYEVFGIAQRRKAVAVGFSQEFHTAGGCQLAEELKHLRSILLNQFKRDTADAECYLEGLAVLGNHVEHRLHCRLVTLLGQFRNGTLVFVVIIVVMIGADVEEAITLQMNRLVYLEV